MTDLNDAPAAGPATALPTASSVPMSVMAVPCRADREEARVLVGEAATARAHVLHCSYYNSYLLRTVWLDAADLVDSVRLLIGAAAEQSYHALKDLFRSQSLVGIAERKAFAASFYAWQGFGTLDLGPIAADGGVTRSRHQHYAEAWKEHFGLSDRPVGLMTQGWLAGAAAAIYDLPQGAFSTHQLECAAVTGGGDNVFELRPDGANYDLFGGEGAGPASKISRRVEGLAGNIDSAGVANAVATLPLFGDADVDGGLIKGFDVLISWHPHLFYDRISLESVRQAVARYGEDGRQAIEPLLEEAGHRCAFRTFGGIWRSPEWEAVVEPMCRTREDWILGMVAVLNCAGWGRIECTRVSEEEAVFVVLNDYESVGCLDLQGKAEVPPSYLMKGGFRGMMNLVYNEDIQSKPALSETFYDRMCRRDGVYETHVETSLAMGDAVSTFRVTRRAPAP